MKIDLLCLHRRQPQPATYDTSSVRDHDEVTIQVLDPKHRRCTALVRDLSLSLADFCPSFGIPSSYHRAYKPTAG